MYAAKTAIGTLVFPKNLLYNESTIKTQEVSTMKSIYEEAGGTYTQQGDYELPNLKAQPEKESEIGVWGATASAILEAVS